MHNNAKITCVYNPKNKKNIARKLQCINMSSLNALVSSKLVNCVIVATPNYLHKKPVIKAAKNKKHVFCKKPIALSYKNCVNIVKACKKASVTFIAKHIINFFNKVQYAQKLIKKSVISKILSCHTKKNS